MILRHYQRAAVRSLWSAYRDGKRAVLIVAPTGSGKTTIATVAARDYLAAHQQAGGRVVWIAHRDELLDQAAATLQRAGLAVGYRGVGASAPVQVRMVQSLARRGEVPEGSLVVLDECHHYAGSNRWTDVARTYLGARAKILGLTATPARADGQALHGFDHLVTSAQISQLQRDGYLVPLVWRGPPRLMPVGKVARMPAEAWGRHASGRRTVVFAPTVEEATRYDAGFAAHGVRSAVVSERSTPEQRARALAELADGRLTVVCNVAVLTEGWDCPPVSCVIVGRRCGSQGLWLQMTGRGLRPSYGKTDCMLLDLCGLAHTLGRPDEDRVYHLDGDGITLAAGAKALGTRLCRVCGAPLPEDSQVCVECGKDHAIAAMRSADEELGDWQVRYEAAKTALQPSRGALCLAGIMRKAEAAARAGKPWKNGAVRFRFEAIMRRAPSGDEMRQAAAVNSAAERFPVDGGGGS